jgi:hypothetical protein
VSAPEASRAANGVVTGAAILMVLCCAVGPAVLGAAAGSFIGGWVGIVCAILLSGVVGLVLVRRRGKDAC